MAKDVKKGFAALSKEALIKVARKGGLASQKSGKGRKFTSDSARIAGQRGGSVPRIPHGKR